MAILRLHHPKPPRFCTPPPPTRQRGGDSQGDHPLEPSETRQPRNPFPRRRKKSWAHRQIKSVPRCAGAKIRRGKFAPLSLFQREKWKQQICVYPPIGTEDISVPANLPFNRPPSTPSSPKKNHKKQCRTRPLASRTVFFFPLSPYATSPAPAQSAPPASSASPESPRPTCFSIRLSPASPPRFPPRAPTRSPSPLRRRV